VFRLSVVSLLPVRSILINIATVAGCLWHPFFCRRSVAGHANILLLDFVSQLRLVRRSNEWKVLQTTKVFPPIVSRACCVSRSMTGSVNQTER